MYPIQEIHMDKPHVNRQCPNLAAISSVCEPEERINKCIYCVTKMVPKSAHIKNLAFQAKGLLYQ